MWKRGSDYFVFLYRNTPDSRSSSPSVIEVSSDSESDTASSDIESSPGELHHHMGKPLQYQLVASLHGSSTPAVPLSRNSAAARAPWPDSAATA